MALVRMTDLKDQRLNPYLKLTDHQLRNALESERGVCICESEVAIRVALAEGVQPLSLLVEEQRLEGIQDLLAVWPKDVDVLVLSEGTSEQVCGYKLYRGVLSAMRRPEPLNITQLLDKVTDKLGNIRLAVMDNLVDVSNVGALFRSAAALGIDGIIVAPTCADPLNRRSIRVSVGTVFQVPWARAGDNYPQGLIKELKADDVTLVSMALSDSAISLRDPQLKQHKREAIFFGNERFGLSQEILKASDYLVEIPMEHGVDSLNVAASSAVTFWELCQ